MRTWCSTLSPKTRAADPAASTHGPRRAGPDLRNKVCTGLGQIVAQVQVSNRDFQSKGWAKSHNLDPPCVKSPSGALRHGERHRCPPPAPPASTSPAPPARPPPSPPPAPAAPRRAPVTTSYVDAAVRLRWQVSDESDDQAAPVTGETHDAHSRMHGNAHSRMRLSW